MSINSIFYNVVNNCVTRGLETEPRGMKVKELIGYHFVLPNPRSRVITFPSRNINYKYLLAEFIWYLGGSNTTDMISKYAPFWKQVQNEDGTVNSNYGTRIFGDHPYFDVHQWANVKRILTKDADSRQAAITINCPGDYTYDNKDVPCTFSLQFFIRDNHLHMITNMRSNDAILGLGNDIFQFTMLQELMCMDLQKQYPGLKLGTYQHFAGSMHIYERHYEMANEILLNEVEYTSDHRVMERMQLGTGDIARLLSVEKIWREKHDCDETFDFTTLGEFRGLSPYWKKLVLACFGPKEQNDTLFADKDYK